MNRLLKFPRPKKAPGRGYILGRVGREIDSIETHDSDDDLDDGIYIDRRLQSHQPLYNHDNHSIVVESSSSDETNHDEDQIAARSTTSGESASRYSYAHQKINIAPLQTATFTNTATNATESAEAAATALQESAGTPTSPKKTTFHSSSSFTNLPKMTTRYRFRDLLLGDFSFNDDGERWVQQFLLFFCFVRL